MNSKDGGRHITISGSVKREILSECDNMVMDSMLFMFHLSQYLAECSINDRKIFLSVMFFFS